MAGTVGAVLTGVATDRLFGGCALRVAMHSCCATGACFLALMLACLCDMPWATHVAAIASIGFFIAGPGGVLGARSGGRWGEIWGEIWGDMGRYGEIWGDMEAVCPPCGRCGERYGEIWGDMGRYGGRLSTLREIWGDMGRHMGRDGGPAASSHTTPSATRASRRQSSSRGGGGGGGCPAPALPPPPPAPADASAAQRSRPQSARSRAGSEAGCES